MAAAAAAAAADAGGDADMASALPNTSSALMQTRRVFGKALAQATGALVQPHKHFPAGVVDSGAGSISSKQLNAIVREHITSALTSSVSEFNVVVCEERHTITAAAGDALATGVSAAELLSVDAAAAALANATAAIATASSASASGSSGSSGGSGGSGDDKEQSANTTPSRRRKSKAKSPAKNKSAAAKEAAKVAAAAAAAAAVISAAAEPTRAAGPAAVQHQVTVAEQMARLEELKTLQHLRVDGIVSVETSAAVAQRLRDAVAESKLLQLNALRARLEQLQATSARLTAELTAKRDAVKAERAVISTRVQHLISAMNAANTWNPPGPAPA